MCDSVSSLSVAGVLCSLLPRIRMCLNRFDGFGGDPFVSGVGARHILSNRLTVEYVTCWFSAGHVHYATRRHLSPYFDICCTHWREFVVLHLVICQDIVLTLANTPQTIVTIMCQ